VFTKEQFKEYLDKDASVCPYCGSDVIENGDRDYAGTIFYQDVGCWNCNAGWREVYQLVGIEEV